MIDYKIILPEKVHEVWPFIEEWVSTSRGEDITFSVNDIKNLCISRKLDLWVISNDNEYLGFCMGKINHAPQGKVYYLPWLGGKNLSRWAEGFLKVKEYARNNGCIFCSFMGRKAWQKMLDIEPNGVYYLVKL